MRNSQIARWTAAAGLLGTFLQVGGFSVYILRAGFPPNTDSEATLAAFLRTENANIQSGVLLFMAGFAVWFVFFAGLRALIIQARPDREYVGTAMFGMAVAFLVLAFVCMGLQAAATANAFTRPDNSVIYGMFMGASILDGAPSALAAAGILGLSGWALYRGRLLSTWTAWLSWASAIVMAATLPLLYRGDDLQATFSADGLVTQVLVFVPLCIWAVALSIALVRRAPTTAPAVDARLIEPA